MPAPARNKDSSRAIPHDQSRDPHVQVITRYPCDVTVLIVWLRVLGAVEVHAEDGRVLTLPRRQERCLLGILLLEAGHTVPMSRLCDLLWDGDPPQKANSAVRTYVARVRSSLARAQAADHDVTLTADSGGYRLVVDPDLVDVHRFRRLIRDAAATGSLVERDKLLGDALALWRGPALYRAASDRVRERLCADLHELHLHAMENRLAVGVELGRHRDLLADLARVAAEHPTRERLTEIHMLALYRAGRTADALDAYTRTRRHLADTLGLDPNPALQRLHTAILRGELVAPDREPNRDRETAGGQGRETAAVAAQLPADLPVFVGRAEHLVSLDRVLAEKGNSPARTVVISAIAGTAGVGKTALAVHWAHRVANRFPDGQLCINLRGFDPSGQPVTPTEAIRRFLHALQVPPHRIPVSLDAQIDLYRTLLARRRMLVLLDNARDTAQVRALLPGASDCLVVITSRNQLTGLIATDGAQPLTLDLLAHDEARHLLARRLGPGRLTAEPGAVDAIITGCARLPLALAIVAGRAAGRPDIYLADLADELRDARHRLGTLTADDPYTDIRAVFSWSYQALGPVTARLFRLLGLHPGADISEPAAASLLGVAPPQVPSTLAELVDANLIVQQTPGRYTFHDLVRAYAAERAGAEERPSDRRAALTRLFDYYIGTAATAMECLHPTEARLHGTATHAPMADPNTALAWLNTERTTLVAVAVHTATDGWPTHTIRLSTTLFRYLETGYYADALTIYRSACTAAQQIGDLIGEANAQTGLGATYLQLGEYRPALEHYAHALRVFRQAGDHLGEARALGNLGVITDRLGDYRAAADHFQNALALFRQIGDDGGQGRALLSLAVIDVHLGRYQQAADRQTDALALFRRSGDQHGESDALNNLGDVEVRLGDHRSATRHLQQALALFRRLANRDGEAWVMTSLGRLRIGLRQSALAANHYRHALALFREIGERDGEPNALNGLGEAASAAGHSTEALDHHDAARIIAGETGDLQQQARAHSGLGQAHAALGQPAHARQHYEHALTLYRDLALPEAAQVRARLAALVEIPSDCR